MKMIRQIVLFCFFTIFFSTSLSFGLPLTINANTTSIRLGELVALEVESSDNDAIKWMIGDEVKSTNSRFYFIPNEVGLYKVKVFKGEVEEDSVDITVTLFPTPQCGNITISATKLGGESKTFVCNIQEALDFVGLDGGGVVNLSSGSFPINQQLIIYDNTTLEGTMEGNNLHSTIRLEDNVQWSDRAKDGSWVPVPPLIINDANVDKTQSMLHSAVGSSNHNITVKNLIIDGNRENQLRKWHSGEGHYTLLDFKDITDLNISNVTLFHGLSDGIFIKTGNNTHISNSNISDMGHSAIYQVEVRNAVVENNRLDVNLNSGIRFFGGSDFLIRNNTIFSSSNYGNYGIQISQAYSAGIPMKNVLIEKNIISKIPYAGIALYASKQDDIAEATIQDNIIVGCGSKAPNLAEFSNTTIEESGGINIQSFKDVTISNNTLYNNYGSGIWIDNRFYSSDVNFEEIENLQKKALISDNIIVGSHATQKSVYGIEKYYSANSTGTDLTLLNNIFFNNQDGSHSSNINLSGSNYLNENPYFIDASQSDLRVEANSTALDNNGKVVIGASLEMLERYKESSL